MPGLRRPERAISPRPMTAAGRKARVDGGARAGGVGIAASVGGGGAADHPEPRRRPGCRHGRPQGVAGRDIGGGAVALRGGEERRPELGAAGQAGGREAPVRGDRSLGEGRRGERGQREHAGLGAGRSAGHRSAPVWSNAAVAASPSRSPLRSSPSPRPGRDRHGPRPPGSGDRGSRPSRSGGRPFPSGFPPSPRPCA